MRLGHLCSASVGGACGGACGVVWIISSLMLVLVRALSGDFTGKWR